jgi:hypothetical protein
MNTYTTKITARDVYDLFQKVYEQASNELVSVYIDVAECTATITMMMPENEVK